MRQFHGFADRLGLARWSRHVAVVAAGMAPCGNVVVLMLWNPGVLLVHLVWTAPPGVSPGSRTRPAPRAVIFGPPGVGVAALSFA